MLFFFFIYVVAIVVVFGIVAVVVVAVGIVVVLVDVVVNRVIIFVAVIFVSVVVTLMCSGLSGDQGAADPRPFDGDADFFRPDPRFGQRNSRRQRFLPRSRSRNKQSATKQSIFSVAIKLPYKRVCPSVRQPVRPSVRPSFSR